ncbi:MAG: LysR family transcriptional regulator [Hyphomicrobiaceae bacterium]|nr:LysR family transcriptional regulator [Hyphomicrobiaceae bacterium]
MDRFHELRVFVAVAEAASFAKAAGALPSSPPAVTRAVAALEERLGVRLFNRTTRRVVLTEPGVRFLEDARRVLSDLETAEQDVRGEARDASGKLAITSSVTFGRSVLQSIVADFVAAHPKVRVSMMLHDRIVDLVDEGFDLAVRIAHLPDSSLVATTVGEVRGMLVASPEYLQTRGKPRIPPDLKTHSVIGHVTLLTGGTWRHVDHGREGRVTVQPIVETNDAHANIALAEAGHGITAVLSYMVTEQIKASKLVPVLETFAAPSVPVHLIYAQRRIVSPKVRAFVDFAVPRLRTKLAETGQSRRTKRAR